MKIVILDGYTLNPGDISWDGFKALGDLTVYDRTPADKVLERIGDAEAVISNKTPLPAEVFAAKPGIKYVGVLATGYNVIDIAAARSRGIPVTNIPTYGTTAVSQYVFALLLEVCHHVGHHADTVKNGRWAASPDFCYWDYPLVELYGKTMGIVGFGRIGQNTARIATAFGMKVLAYDEHVNPTLETTDVAYATLGELYAGSDVISLHVPLFDSTKEMINSKSISKMKDGVIIINTSRGPLVSERDILKALDDGKVAAYAADVVSIEPILADNPLPKHERCLITPHIAWAPQAARERLMNIAVDNLGSFIKGNPINVVNP